MVVDAPGTRGSDSGSDSWFWVRGGGEAGAVFTAAGKSQINGKERCTFTAFSSCMFVVIKRVNAQPRPPHAPPLAAHNRRLNGLVSHTSAPSRTHLFVERA